MARSNFRRAEIDFDLSDSETIIAEAKKQQKEAAKRLAEAEARLAEAKSAKKAVALWEKWDAVEKARTDIEDVLKRHGVSLADLKTFPIRYKYRLGTKRSNDGDVGWIKALQNGGGTLAELEQNNKDFERKFILKSFTKKMTKKRKSESSKQDDDSKSDSGTTAIKGD